MKHINKQPEPNVFTIWKQRKPLHNREAKLEAYKRFKKTSKINKPIKEALINEQGHICCYCERRLTEEDSHIEHLRPKSDPTVDPLDFGNLLCSCGKDWTAETPKHCGVLKDNWFDQSLFISPLDSVCETKFSFTEDGYIKPSCPEDPAAKTTIEKLGLNINNLVTDRKSAIDVFNETVVDLNISEEERRLFITSYLSLSNGQFSPFWSTIKYLFGGLTE